MPGRPRPCVLYSTLVTARRVAPFAAAVVVLALAAVGFVEYVPVHHVATARMARLVAAKPPPGFGGKPSVSSPEKSSTSSFAAVKAAAKSDPGATGTYTVEWTKPSPSHDTATALLSLLPTSALAARTDQQARSAYLGKKSQQSQYYSYSGPLSIATPPGSDASLFKATTAGGPPLAVVAFQVQRAQVVIFSAIAGPPSQSAAVARSLAAAEYGQLRRNLPGFSLRYTTWPLTATTVYWAATAGILGLIVAVPAAARKSKERRRRAREATRRRQLQGRGSKIARRQASRSR